MDPASSMRDQAAGALEFGEGEGGFETSDRRALISAGKAVNPNARMVPCPMT